MIFGIQGLENLETMLMFQNLAPVSPVSLARVHCKLLPEDETHAVLVLRTQGKRCEGALSLTTRDHKVWAGAFTKLDGVVFWDVLAVAKLAPPLPVISKTSCEVPRGLQTAQRTRKWVEVSEAYLTLLRQQVCCANGETNPKTVHTFLEKWGMQIEFLPLLVSVPPTLTSAILEETCKLFALAPQQAIQKRRQQRRIAKFRRCHSPSLLHCRPRGPL